jgi:hypothetical protein
MVGVDEGAGLLEGEELSFLGVFLGVSCLLFDDLVGSRDGNVEGKVDGDRLLSKA